MLPAMQGLTIERTHVQRAPTPTCYRRWKDVAGFRKSELLVADPRPVVKPSRGRVCA